MPVQPAVGAGNDRRVPRFLNIAPCYPISQPFTSREGPTIPGEAPDNEDSNSARAGPSVMPSVPVGLASAVATDQAPASGASHLGPIAVAVLGRRSLRGRRHEKRGDGTDDAPQAWSIRPSTPPLPSARRRVHAKGVAPDNRGPRRRIPWAAWD